MRREIKGRELPEMEAEELLFPTMVIKNRGLFKSPLKGEGERGENPSKNQN